MVFVTIIVVYIDYNDDDDDANVQSSRQLLSQVVNDDHTGVCHNNCCLY